MLTELYAERSQIDEAIRVLELLAVSGRRKRGRPPKWMVKAQAIKSSQNGYKAEPQKIRLDSRKAAGGPSLN